MTLHSIRRVLRLFASSLGLVALAACGGGGTSTLEAAAGRQTVPAGAADHALRLAYDVEIKRSSFGTAHVFAHNSGSSYVSALAFGPNGPQVDTVLIPGQSVNPASPYYYDQLEHLWSQRQWHRLPFRPEQIRTDPNLTVMRIKQ